MNPIQVASVCTDQLINQIIHQGKARERAYRIWPYSVLPSVRGYELRPAPGSRDNQLNPSQGAGDSERVARQRLNHRNDWKDIGFNIRSAILSPFISITWKGV